jgi:hypothetical protein
MKKRKGITHKQYQTNHLNQRNQKINDELDHDLNIQNVSPIIQALADKDRVHT